jgi:hypothetical protein
VSESTLGYLHLWCLPVWRDGICSDLMFLFPGMTVHSRLDVSGFYDCYVLCYAPSDKRKYYLDQVVARTSGEVLYDWMPLFR